MDEYVRREDVLETLRKASIGGYITDKLLEIPAVDVLPMKYILRIVQGRLNRVDYTMSEAIKSNDIDTVYRMKGANDVCNEILADLEALTAKDGDR